MPRRGGRERYRTPKQATHDRSTSFMTRDMRYPLLDPDLNAHVLRGEHQYHPPSWMVVGVMVDYHSIIGQPVEAYPAGRKDCMITVEPFKVNGGSQWVVVIDKVRGWVACEALSPAGKV